MFIRKGESMRTVQCPSCNLEINGKDKECPYCGFRLKKSFSKGNYKFNIVEFIMDVFVDCILDFMGDLLNIIF